MALFAISDLRDAARGLLRSPTISISAILCLGLGLGATAAISSAIDRALLQAPPFRDPGSLVAVYRTAPQAKSWPHSVPNYLDVSHASKQLSAVAAFAGGNALLTLPGDAQQINTLAVTGNFFPMLGAAPQYGRFLTPADDASDQNKVVVLSDELWRARFGADPTLIGRTIQLDGAAVTVIGIAPREFRVPLGTQILQPEAWLPLRFSPQQLGQRRSNFLRAIGRLAPGATVATAQQELNTIFHGLETSFPDLHGEGLRVTPLLSDATASVRTPLLLVFGAVCMVLLIAATDVASLLLARSVHRRRETAIRLALGGNAWAVTRPILFESALLALLGVTLGLGLGWAGVKTIGAVAAKQLPQLAGARIDLRIIAFALVLALVVSIACSAWPAWRASSIDPQDALRDGRGGGMGRAQHRMLGGLVIAEVALSLILLIGAGLVLKGFVHLASQKPGFDPDQILTLNVTISPQQYPDNTSFSKFLEPAITAIQRVPGVASAAAISLLPYRAWGSNSNTRYEGVPADNPTQLPLVENRVITPGFFDVTKQHLISGRALRQSDDERDESPYVVVVNQSLVKRDFPDGVAVGKRFYTGDTTFGTIVGVVSDIKNVGPIAPPAPEMYSTYRQAGSGPSVFSLMIRVRSGDPAAVINGVRAALRGVDPTTAVTRVATMNDVMANSVGTQRFYLTLLGTFAVVAVLLALAGLYGVLSYAVAQRTRELGIRTALGSGTARTMVLVSGQGMRLIGVGLLVGLGGAALLTRLLASLLYGVSPLDPSAWIAASLLLTGAGLVATVVPSVRATRVDPLTAMRVDG